MPPRKNPNEPFYKHTLPNQWKESYEKATEYTFDNIIKDAFYVAHGRIQYLLKNYGKFNRQAEIIISIAEELANPENEDIPDNQKISQDFLHELKLLFLGLSPDALVRNLNSTITLADGAQRLALNDSGSTLRQLDICKSVLINILKYSKDTASKEMVLAAIAQLKLEAGLPVEEIDAIMAEIKKEKEVSELEESKQDEYLLEASKIDESIED